MGNIDTTRATGSAGSGDWTGAERDAVIAETASILADPAFMRSHRCTALLRSMVDHALHGEREGIKERTLGIEVFGRESNYDSNADPIVRMAANEIRKRLAQYYQDRTREHRVVIRLVPGCYIPEFEFAQPSPAEAPPAEEPEASNVVPDPPPPAPAPYSPPNHGVMMAKPLRWALLGMLLLAAVGVSLAVGYSKLFPGPQYAIWKPLMQSANPPILCVADNTTLEKKGQEPVTAEETRIKLQRLADVIQNRKAPAIADPANYDPATPFVDANVAHEITIWLGTHQQSSLLRPSSGLTLQDFRNRPLVLVGGFDNPWTVILLSDMRFSPRVDPATGTFWIRDAQAPAKREWTKNAIQGAEPALDYAVITRVLDAETGNWIMGIAGLGPQGTEAASHLLVDPDFAQFLPSSITSAKNFQIVVRTKAINGNTGTPQIVASYAW